MKFTVLMVGLIVCLAGCSSQRTMPDETVLYETNKPFLNPYQSERLPITMRTSDHQIDQAILPEHGEYVIWHQTTNTLHTNVQSSDPVLVSEPGQDDTQEPTPPAEPNIQPIIKAAFSGCKDIVCAYEHNVPCGRLTFEEGVITNTKHADLYHCPDDGTNCFPKHIDIATDTINCDNPLFSIHDDCLMTEEKQTDCEYPELFICNPDAQRCQQESIQ